MRLYHRHGPACSPRSRPAPRPLAVATLLVACWAPSLAASQARAQETIEVGETGFAVKRPVLASACAQGCPWGELGDFVKEAMEPLGYEVILCRNCNRTEGPRIVAKASYPPELGPQDSFVGTTTRVNAPVDFGITESGFLAWAFGGHHTYAQDGPYANLRLIAKIEDPTYLLVAVKAASDITDLAQIAAERRPVKILGGESPTSRPVLDHYGLTREAVTSWGGSFGIPILEGANATFDVIVSDLASPANNLESSYWTALSQKHDLRFLELPAELLDAMANDATLGMRRVTAKWGLLRGIDRPIATVARSGEAIFAREDTPEQAAYDVAKAVDVHRGALKWYIRPYSYDPHTVWENHAVPLHPGAARYYRELGYLATEAAASDGGSSPDAAACMPPAEPEAKASDGGCHTAAGAVPRAHGFWFGAVLLSAAFALWRRNRSYNQGKNLRNRC
jgi:TRAP-type uncharacterized transport system substrate-binding protein